MTQGGTSANVGGKRFLGYLHPTPSPCSVAADAMRSKNLRVWPVIDYDDLIPGVLTTRRAHAMPLALQPS
ncbi:hypothetical protein ABH931_003954 [Streptacidiphilus sp. MAP12-33]